MGESPIGGMGGACFPSQLFLLHHAPHLHGGGVPLTDGTAQGGSDVDEGALWPYGEARGHGQAAGEELDGEGEDVEDLGIKCGKGRCGDMSLEVERGRAPFTR